ncbi:Uncharacterised protein [Turicibacter sanguinis]|nr:Uncharacterised protein [Turicibacter sanguinis]
MTNELNTLLLNEVDVESKDKELEALSLNDRDIEALDLDFPNDCGLDEEFESEKTIMNEEIIVSEEDDFSSFTLPEDPIEETITQNELEELELDLFLPSMSTPVSKVTSVSKGLVSIIYAKTGKRIIFEPTLIEELGLEETIQVGYNDCHLLLGSNLSPQYKNRKLKKQGKKYVLYDAALIQELIKNFNLDYTGVTSRTFDDVIYKQHQGSKVALITIKK